MIDQTTGLVTAQGETPYHGAYNIQAPIRVSVDGQYVLLGSGDIYGQATLNWSGSLGSQVADARWFADGSMVTLTTANNQTTLRRLGATSLATLEQLTYTGQALRVVGTDTRMAVVVINNDTVQIHTYVPSDDSDGDGVATRRMRSRSMRGLGRYGSATVIPMRGTPAGARPTAPRAWRWTLSRRTPRAGWRRMAAAAFATTAPRFPNYTPDQVVQHGDVVYLLSSVNRRVYRWSISGART